VTATDFEDIVVEPDEEEYGDVIERPDGARASEKLFFFRIIFSYA
jgi:hypothetical protein